MVEKNDIGVSERLHHLIKIIILISVAVIVISSLTQPILDALNLGLNQYQNNDTIGFLLSLVVPAMYIGTVVLVLRLTWKYVLDGL